MIGRRVAGMWLLVLVSLGLITGCGGPLKPDELQRRVETLESTAAAGRLLAGAVASDQTKATFVRAHARDLGEDATHEAEKVSDSVGLEPQRLETVGLATDVADAIGELQVDPGDERVGARVVDELEQLEARAKQLRSEI